MPKRKQKPRQRRSREQESALGAIEINAAREIAAQLWPLWKAGLRPQVIMPLPGPVEERDRLRLEARVKAELERMLSDAAYAEWLQQEAEVTGGWDGARSPWGDPAR